MKFVPTLVTLWISPTAFIAARAASRLALDIPAFAGLPPRIADCTAAARWVTNTMETTHTQSPAIVATAMTLPVERFLEIGAS